jgi:hypothetical protein
MRTIMFFFFGCIIAAILYIGRPTDQECRDEVTRRNAGGIVAALASHTGADGLIYQVEDNIFWKTIYFTPTGQRVGVGFMGHVFC